MSKKLRILFAGGGTGGHIYPIIAVSEKLRAWTEKNGTQADFRYFGNPGAFRDALTANNIGISRVAESKWRRYFSLLNFLDIFKFGFSVVQCLWKIYWFMPDVIFSKGGPGSFPVVLVGFFYATPVVIHESDAVPGLANRLASRFARVIGLAFSSAAKRFPKTTAKLDVVGNPVRSELLVMTSSQQAKAALGFNPSKPLMLVFGGSQGSNRMNDFIIGNLEAILLKFQIMHVIGREKFDDYKNQYDFLTKNFSPILLANYKFSSYLGPEMSQAMDAADLIVARGGAGAIFEIAAKGKPAIIVPFPEASADHQKENGYAYAATGAAVVIEQDNLLLSIFMDQAGKLALDSEINAKMSSAAKAFYQADCSDRIAVDILELLS